MDGSELLNIYCLCNKQLLHIECGKPYHQGWSCKCCLLIPNLRIVFQILIPFLFHNLRRINCQISKIYAPTSCSLFYMLILAENLQDMMLCGGSDAAIIPIGTSRFLLKVSNVLPLVSDHRLWCRIGGICRLQSTVKKEHWSHQSLTSLG